jgi:hypothetical protein
MISNARFLCALGDLCVESQRPPLSRRSLRIDGNQIDAERYVWRRITEGAEDTRSSFERKRRERSGANKISNALSSACTAISAFNLSAISAVSALSQALR